MDDFDRNIRHPLSESTFSFGIKQSDISVQVDLPMGNAPKTGAVPDASGDSGAEPVDMVAGLLGLVSDLLKMGYNDIAGWVKSWGASSTTHSSVSDIVIPIGERLVFKFIAADDEAFIVFNDEKIASKNRGETPTTHVSSHAVREGLNILTIGVDNRGRLDWYVVIDVFEERSRKPLGRIAFKGNDGIYDNFHFISGRIWGR